MPRPNHAGSFADVFREHRHGAVRLAWVLTGDPHQAEDAVAEAFAKVWPRWERGRIDDIGPYLRRAVVNEVRSKGRRKVIEHREAERRRGDERGVHLVADAVADHDEVWNALGRLPERQRHVIVLRYYEDLSEADIARVLQVSSGTVKSQAARGMARLRQLIGQPTTSGGA